MYFIEHAIWECFFGMGTVPHNAILTYLEVKGETNPLWDKWPIEAKGYAFSSGGWAILPSSIARDS